MSSKTVSNNFGFAKTIAALGAALALAACGGGGDALTSDFSSTKVTGTVVDGPIRGASVFLDLNGNLALDGGEPVSLPSAASGAFELVTGNLTQAQLAAAMFVTHVPDTAYDADDAGLSIAAAGRRSFTLVSPASAYLSVSGGQSSAAAPLVSPLTTLVAAEMAFKGLSIAAAKAQVQQRAALGSKDPMTDFVASADQEMANKARVIAIGLGELIASAAQTSPGSSMRDTVRTALEALHAALPSMLASIDTSGTSTTPVPVTSVTTALSSSKP